MTALDILASQPRWVTWRLQKRGNKATKVPYSPQGGPAKSDDPATWATRPQAELVARRFPNGPQGGIGIELGDLGGDLHLAGVDLDSCLTDGKFEPWAQEVIARFDSYTEVSPSSTGAKIFFFLESAAVPAIRQAMGTDHGREWKRAGGDHPRAIELHISNRYFAVTGTHLAYTPDSLEHVAAETILWLIREAGPRFAGRQEPGLDKSRSGKAFREGARLRREGKTFEEMCEALRNSADPDVAAWVREKGDERQLRRIWDKAVPRGEIVPFSEDDLAERFSVKHGDELRYLAIASKWYRWGGDLWRTEETLAAFDLARAICREAARDPRAPQPDEIAKAKTVAAVERLAKADRRHATEHHQWDRDRWIFNPPKE
jgi:hypothetical protein